MIILADDVIKLASTLTATSTASGFSVNNLKNDRKSSAWRSTAITSQTITATWSAPVSINAVGVAFANLLVGSTLRARSFVNTGDSSPAADTGVQTVAFAYPPPQGFASNNWQSFAYGGGNDYFLQLPQINARKLELILTNPAGVDSFIDVARVVAGLSFGLEYAASYGAGIGLDDASEIARTDAGSTVIDRRPASRTAEFDLPAMSHAERATIQAIVRRNGRHTPIFFSAYQPGVASLRADMMIYGYFDDPDMMALTLPKYSSYRMRIREI